MLSRTPWSRGGRLRSAPLTLALAALAVVLAPGPVHRADAYRFFPLEGAGFIPVASEATRWSSTIWGPGDTLVWEIADIPHWSHWFGSAEGVLPVVQKGLEAWSDIPTADISWRVEIDGGGGDVQPVTIDPNTDSNVGGYAGIRGRGARITGCSMTLGSWAAKPPPEWWHELEEDHLERVYPRLGTMIHEFGHCLGLDHSVEMPGRVGLTVRYEFDADRDQYRHAWVTRRDIPPRDAQMTYGYSDPGIEYPVALDDIVGASLLRPARGWERGVGSIAGQVLLDGEPLRYAHVYAFGNGSTRGLPNAVGAFSNRDGDFVIEGLQPGVYTLWVSVMGNRLAHAELVGRGSLIDLAETLRPFPVVVTAGQTTEGVQVHARRGRDCRPPAPCGRR